MGITFKINFLTSHLSSTNNGKFKLTNWSQLCLYLKSLCCTLSEVLRLLFLLKGQTKNAKIFFITQILVVHENGICWHSDKT